MGLLKENCMQKHGTKLSPKGPQDVSGDNQDTT